ncbi:MAG: MBL fold metallo-hydrolase [Devosiaceae bacterium]|nr:MBL fold metallo-hydrolase [Devosiaceae bacterium]
MPQSMLSPRYNRNFAPTTGECVTIAPSIARICAPNASPYTFTGTNSYIIGEHEIVIIDPGPDLDEHFEALISAINGRKTLAILLTHTHKDHCAIAPRLAQKLNAPIWFGGQHRLSRAKRMFEENLLHKACDWELRPDKNLADGENFKVDDLTIEVIATPGHCANHLSFGIKGQKFLFSGDHVMGWNSTLVATPDGSLTSYFNSLDKLIEQSWSHYLPGHGGEIVDHGQGNNAKNFTSDLRRHRQNRNSQILELVNNGPKKPAQIVKSIYPDASAKIRIAAMMSVMAHVEYLEHKEKLVVRRGLFGTRITAP